MNRWAAMTVDPGGHTGVARGVFELDQDSVPKCIGWARNRELLETFQIEIGDANAGRRAELAVAKRICEEWRDWRAEACLVWQVPNAQCRLVFEDFVPRAKALTMQREVLLPVRIAAHVEGMLVKEFGPEGQDEIDYQQAGHVMGYANNDRLRRWGLWVTGSDHQRDANRHLAARLNRALRGE